MKLTCTEVFKFRPVEWPKPIPGITIFKPSDTPETDPTPSPDTPPRGTRPNQKEIA